MIRVQPSSPPACAALSFAAKTAGRLPVCSPPCPFGTGGSLLAGAPAGDSCPEPATRGDLSLTRNDCPLPDHHYGVNVPGLPLRSRARPLPGTVPPAATPIKPVCTRHDRYQGRWPVSRLTVRHSRARIGSPLPLRGFRPLRIKAFNPTWSRKARLPNPPDCPSLPTAALFCSRRRGSSFRTRYVSGGPLFLKPLGTFPIMHSGYK